MANNIERINISYQCIKQISVLLSCCHIHLTISYNLTAKTIHLCNSLCKNSKIAYNK